MKNRIKILLGAVIGSSLLFSSCNFLDVDSYFQATFKEDSIFHSTNGKIHILVDLVEKLNVSVRSHTMHTSYIRFRIGHHTYKRRQRHTILKDMITRIP